MENSDIILETCKNISNELTIIGNNSHIKLTDNIVEKLIPIGGKINTFENLKNNYSFYAEKICSFFNISSSYFPLLLVLIFILLIIISFFIYNKFFNYSLAPIITITKYENNESDKKDVNTSIDLSESNKSKNTSTEDNSSNNEKN